MWPAISLRYGGCDEKDVAQFLVAYAWRRVRVGILRGGLVGVRSVSASMAGECGLPERRPGSIAAYAHAVRVSRRCAMAASVSAACWCLSRGGFGIIRDGGRLVRSAAGGGTVRTVAAVGIALYGVVFRHTADGGRRVRQLLRGGAVSVGGAILVVWSQSGGVVPVGDEIAGRYLAAGVLSALGCSCGPVAAAMGLVWARAQAGIGGGDVWSYVAFWRACSAVCGVTGSLAAHMWSGTPGAGVAPLAFLFCYALVNGCAALLWSLAWRRAGHQAPALQFLGSASAPLSVLALWGLGLDSPGSPVTLIVGCTLVAGGNRLVRQ